MIVVIRHTKSGRRALPAEADEVKAEFEAGKLRKHSASIYEELSPSEYLTRDMKPRKRRGRPRKNREPEAEQQTSDEPGTEGESEGASDGE